MAESLLRTFYFSPGILFFPGARYDLATGAIGHVVPESRMVPSPRAGASKRSRILVGMAQTTNSSSTTNTRTHSSGTAPSSSTANRGFRLLENAAKRLNLKANYITVSPSVFVPTTPARLLWGRSSVNHRQRMHTYPALLHPLKIRDQRHPGITCFQCR